MTDVMVIVATHDRPQMLEVALHSILASAAMVPESVRILVVDDASVDRTAEMVASRCGVRYLRNDRNMGVGPTLARGFAETESEFTVFWGDDDFMLPRFLPLHLAKIREGYDAVSGSYFTTDHSLRIVREHRLPLVTFRDLMRGKCSGNDQSLFRRSALPPWRPERERAMLMTMWLALTQSGARLTTIGEPTWLYRRHTDQLSHTTPRGRDMALRQAAIDEYRAVPV